MFDNFKKACDDYNLKMNTVLELLLEDFSTGDYDIIINRQNGIKISRKKIVKST